jgi:hypothetical protein
MFIIYDNKSIAGMYFTAGYSNKGIFKEKFLNA